MNATQYIDGEWSLGSGPAIAVVDPTDETAVGIGGEDGKWGFLRYLQIKTVYPRFGRPTT